MVGTVFWWKPSEGKNN